MFDGFICEEDKKFNINNLSDFMSDMFNNKIKYIYKPIKNNNDIIKPVPKDFTYDIRRIKANYYIRKLQENYIDIFDMSDGTFSKIICLFYSNNFIFQNEEIYIYYKNKWIKNNTHPIKSYIEEKLKVIYNLILNEFVQLKIECKDDEEQKKYDTKIKDIMKVSYRINFDSTLNSSVNSLKNNLSKRLDKVEFDVSLPYVICFNNKAFDIRTGEEIEIHKLDYISFSTGYNYIKPTKKDRQEIETVIDNIFTNEETKKTYLSILWTCLSGVRQERFIMATGGGRNGKGLINELMLKM